MPKPLKPLLSLIAALALTGALAACGSSDSSDPNAQKIAVTITDDGCSPTDLKAEAGPTTFMVSNDDSAINTEFEVLDGALIIGEKENLTAGLTGEVSANLDPGTYDIVCGHPGDRTPTGKLVVTGKAREATENPLLKTAALSYKKYVIEQTNLLTAKAEEFAAAVKAGDVEKAKSLYETSRIPYEKIEPVAESFGGLDPAIDARENDVSQGDPWTGYHPLEKALWVTGLTAADDRLADQLVVNIKKLQKLAKNTDYDPVQLANGSVELLNEVSQSKITGEEERYSHVDLTTFKANVQGAQDAFELLKPALTQTDPELARQTEEDFTKMYAELDPYKVSGDVYENYSTITPAERQKLSQAVDTLANSLAQIGGKVVAQ